MTTRSAFVAPEFLVFVVLVAVATAVGAYLYLQRPPIGRATVLATLPWIVVGVALHALRVMVGYPEVVLPVMAFPWIYLLTGALAGLVWILLASVLAPGRRAVCPHYFGVMGIGVLLPLTVVLVVRGIGVAPEVLVAWLAVPLVAAVVTYVVMIGLGLWMPDCGYFAGSAGAAVTYGLAIDGIATALAFGFGARIAAPIGFPVVVEAVPVDWLTQSMAVVWATVWLRLVFAVALLLALTAIDRWRPAVAERGLELTTVLTAVVAANTFLFALGGGFA